MPTGLKQIDRTSGSQHAATSRVVFDQRGNWWRRLLHQYLIEPFVSSSNPPWFDARGVAVGLLVGFGCPVGGQVMSLALLRAIFRFNSILAFAATWVTNPFTFIPMYYGYYYVGSLILGSTPSFDHASFMEVLRPLMKADYFWESLPAFVALGKHVLARWFVTASLVSPVSVIVGYVVTYRLQKIRCIRKAQQLGVTYENLLADLENRLHTNNNTPAEPGTDRRQ